MLPGKNVKNLGKNNLFIIGWWFGVLLSFPYIISKFYDQVGGGNLSIRKFFFPFESGARRLNPDTKFFRVKAQMYWRQHRITRIARDVIRIRLFFLPKLLMQNNFTSSDKIVCISSSTGAFYFFWSLPNKNPLREEQEVKRKVIFHRSLSLFFLPGLKIWVHTRKYWTLLSKSDDKIRLRTKTLDHNREIIMSYMILTGNFDECVLNGAIMFAPPLLYKSLGCWCCWTNIVGEGDMPVDPGIIIDGSIMLPFIV